MKKIILIIAISLTIGIACRVYSRTVTGYDTYWYENTISKLNINKNILLRIEKKLDTHIKDCNNAAQNPQ